jgi:hypothetical protein
MYLLWAICSIRLPRSIFSCSQQVKLGVELVTCLCCNFKVIRFIFVINCWLQSGNEHRYLSAGPWSNKMNPLTKNRYVSTNSNCPPHRPIYSLYITWDSRLPHAFDRLLTASRSWDCLSTHETGWYGLLVSFIYCIEIRERHGGIPARPREQWTPITERMHRVISIYT